MFDALRPIRTMIENPIPRAAMLAGLILAVAAPAAWAQQIYKTVDEDGNVVYTDQKPSDDAEPIPLPELTVVDPVELGDPAVAGGQGQGQGQESEMAQIEFSITSPMADEVIVNTAYRLDVRVDLDADLPRSAQIVYLVDGEEKLTSREMSVTLEGIERGPHQVSAEVRDSNGRVLAATEPVSFFMRQQSALYRRPG